MPLLNTKQLAEELGRDMRTIHELRKQGLPYINLGTGDKISPGYDLDKVNAWLDGRTTPKLTGRDSE